MALTTPEREVRVVVTDPIEDAFFAASAAVPRGWRVELIEGQLHVTPPANGEHEEIVMELSGQFRDQRRDLGSYTGIGLELPGSAPTHRVIPDLTLAPKGSFRDDLEWHDPQAVLLVAEVTSASTAANDRVRKLQGYAGAGIPAYLLVDREAGSFRLYSEPEDGTYTRMEEARLGMAVRLPAPLDFELDTSEF
ncbi:Uma2 family endonuclease [Streptomyces polyrhachis]|uniref:Uma2 family endonuclease n=1 Tax=Streptomyces polyrhachis TaxID=1282885 RepID=A0ABW2GF73_9ACTN